jgi:hypothetical protein
VRIYACRLRGKKLIFEYEGKVLKFDIFSVSKEIKKNEHIVGLKKREYI